MSFSTINAFAYGDDRPAVILPQFMETYEKIDAKEFREYAEYLNDQGINVPDEPIDEFWYEGEAQEITDYVLSRIAELAESAGYGIKETSDASNAYYHFVPAA